MTTTTPATQNSSVSLWAKRVVAGGLLSLAPALIGFGAAADSFADTDPGKQGAGPGISRSIEKARAHNGGVKHHHNNRQGRGSVDGGGSSE
jgi:hypothetical protein